MTVMQSTPARTRTYGAFFLSSAIWGSTFLVIRLGNNAAVPPVWAATLRLGLATALLIGLTYLMRQRMPRGAALRAAAWYGFFEFGVNFPLLYWAETTVPSGLTSVFYATIPITTPLLAWMIGQETLSLRKILGALAALVGVVIIFGGEIGTGTNIWPLLALVVSSTTAGFAGVMLRRAPPQAAIPANAVGAAVGFVICLLASFAMGERHAIPTRLPQWGPIVYLAIMGSMGAFLLWSWLLKHWSATAANFVSVIVPVIAVLL
ncbi:MAG TPA: EamA family transporter, partial [Actinomycetota bacterium]|nr:EamA family transporter [Actinomycetota bacterium]